MTCMKKLTKLISKTCWISYLTSIWMVKVKAMKTKRAKVKVVHVYQLKRNVSYVMRFAKLCYKPHKL